MKSLRKSGRTLILRLDSHSRITGRRLILGSVLRDIRLPARCGSGARSNRIAGPILRPITPVVIVPKANQSTPDSSHSHAKKTNHHSTRQHLDFNHDSVHLAASVADSHPQSTFCLRLSGVLCPSGLGRHTNKPSLPFSSAFHSLSLPFSFVSFALSFALPLYTPLPFTPSPFPLHVPLQYHSAQSLVCSLCSNLQGLINRVDEPLHWTHSHLL